MGGEIPAWGTSLEGGSEGNLVIGPAQDNKGGLFCACILDDCFSWPVGKIELALVWEGGWHRQVLSDPVEESGARFGIGSFEEPESGPVAYIWEVGFGWGLELVMVWGLQSWSPRAEHGKSCGLIREAGYGFWGLPQIGGLVWRELD